MIDGREPQVHLHGGILMSDLNTVLCVSWVASFNTHRKQVVHVKQIAGMVLYKVT